MHHSEKQTAQSRSHEPHADQRVPLCSGGHRGGQSSEDAGGGSWPSALWIQHARAKLRGLWAGEPEAARQGHVVPSASGSGLLFLHRASGTSLVGASALGRWVKPASLTSRLTEEVSKDTNFPL